MDLSLDEGVPIVSSKELGCLVHGCHDQWHGPSSRSECNTRQVLVHLEAEEVALLGVYPNLPQWVKWSLAASINNPDAC